MVWHLAPGWPGRLGMAALLSLELWVGVFSRGLHLLLAGLRLTQEQVVRTVSSSEQNTHRL